MFVHQARVIFIGALLLGVSKLICLGSSPVLSQSTNPAPCDYCSVKVSLRVLERTSKVAKFQATITNEGTRPVLIVTNPMRADGSAGPYLSLNADEPSMLELGFRAFPPPGFDILATNERVTYTSLEPEVPHHEEVSLLAPIEETEPPWRGMAKPRQIDLGRIQYVKLNVGVFPDEPEVREAFAYELSPTGLELVKRGRFKGKSLYKIQGIVSSGRIKF